jgi:hypothetical protein
MAMLTVYISKLGDLSPGTRRLAAFGHDLDRLLRIYRTVVGENCMGPMPSPATGKALVGESCSNSGV